jgi:hypothetical protein
MLCRVAKQVGLPNTGFPIDQKRAAFGNLPTVAPQAVPEAGHPFLNNHDGWLFKVAGPLTSSARYLRKLSRREAQIISTIFEILKPEF